jgi:arabinofuranosyltransferase
LSIKYDKLPGWFQSILKYFCHVLIEWKSHLDDWPVGCYIGGTEKDGIVHMTSRNTYLWIVNIVLILGVLGAVAAEAYRYHNYYQDDAYIPLRYVHNFLNGHGLVWNPGERVEGYTDFFHVVLISILGGGGMDLVTASQVISLGAYILLAVFLLMWVHREPEAELYAYYRHIPVVVTIASAPLIVWAFGGLETTLFCLIGTIFLCFSAGALNGNVRMTLLCALFGAIASLIRPEGAIFFGILCLFLLIRGMSGDKIAQRQLVMLIITFGVLYGPFLVWRYSYYGYLLPNTWYAKGGFYWQRFGRGALYLWHYASSIPFLPLLAVAAVAYATVTRSWNRYGFFLLTVILGFIAYITAVGGDHMPAFRFFVPIMPAFGLLIYHCMRSLAQKGIGKHGPITLSALVCLVLLQIILPPQLVDTAKCPDGAGFLGRIVGDYITQTWPKGSLIALNTAGSTPYFAPDMRFIDMLGLNDTTIARSNARETDGLYQWVPGHEKGNGNYVFRRDPDFIIAGPSNGLPIYCGWFQSEKELAARPDFHDRYKYEELLLPVERYNGYTNYKEALTGKMVFRYYRRIHHKVGD